MTPEEREYWEAVDNVNAALAAWAEGESKPKKPTRMTLTIPLTTGLLMHKVAQKLVFAAESEGFEVNHTHDGGRLEREHRIVITGEPAAVTRFQTAVEEWSKRVERDLEAR